MPIVCQAATGRRMGLRQGSPLTTGATEDAGEVREEALSIALFAISWSGV